MTPSDDDAILRQLKREVDDRLRPSTSMVEMIMTGYDITNLDAHLAELVADMGLEAAEVRSSERQPRLITCSTGLVTFEFEVQSASPHVIGHLDAPGPGSLAIDQAGHSEQQDLDELAAFEFSLPTLAPFRLRFQPSTGLPTVTDWILP